MARLTGEAIIREYSPGKRENSFYQEQIFGDKIDGDYILEHSKSATVYYNEDETGYLKAKETLLLG